MIFILIIALITCITMILGILFFPKIKIGKIKIDSYWFVVLIGAIILVLISKTKISTIISSLTQNTAINPIKILILFISMTILSIFLDEVGFFQYLANYTLQKAKTSQIKMFIYLFLIVSILTVFTSNDIIILSFTPFICYFAKRAKISPIPYLASEFVAANTWSMALVIGNPTNIYLATSYSIDFLSYFKVMIIPTICTGIVAFLLLFLIYHKNLKAPIVQDSVKQYINKPLLIIGLIHLSICTIMLAIASYINIEMWLVSLISLLSLILCTSIYYIIKRQMPIELLHSIRRAPWQLIPFVISMFVMILVIQNNGITEKINSLLGESMPILKYGLTSFLSANVINNIPMSVLYSAIISPLSGNIQMKAVYASIIGSNIGAFLTPIGALAGIMWTNIIGSHNLKFNYIDFLKLGLRVAIPSILVALGVLSLVLL